MKSYEQLTIPGKMRRLHKMALNAVGHYDLKDPRVTFHCYETNLLYQVTQSTGEKYILRIASPRWRTFEDLKLEAAWLTALKEEPDIYAPEVIPSRIGEYVIQVSQPGVPQARNCTLMTFVPGRLLGHHLTEANLQKMGALFAKLHIHGASWRPPEGYDDHRFEYWVSRGEKIILFENSPAGKNNGEPTAQVIFDPQHYNLLKKVDKKVEDAYAAIDRSDLRIIHCDLWHDNIKLHKGVLYPIDFEDTILGFRAHDIAMAMLDLLETTGMDRYPQLLNAFKQGYSELLSWPDDPIEPFQIGRMLWIVNWTATYEPARFSKTLERYIPAFQHYLKTDRVILPTAE